MREIDKQHEPPEDEAATQISQRCLPRPVFERRMNAKGPFGIPVDPFIVGKKVIVL